LLSDFRSFGTVARKCCQMPTLDVDARFDGWVDCLGKVGGEEEDSWIGGHVRKRLAREGFICAH